MAWLELPGTAVSVRYSLAHRLERRARFTWERVTWGPLYFVRRLVCCVWGHNSRTDYRCEVDFHGETYCQRCGQEL